MDAKVKQEVSRTGKREQEPGTREEQKKIRHIRQSTSSRKVRKNPYLTYNR